MFNFTALPPLSLYIHVPWCIKKCPYCDFNSHKSPDDLPEQDYIDALIRDLEQELPTIWGRTIQTIFIGGGTPSLFSAEAYERLFSSLRALLPISHNTEITLEANPGTFEQHRFADYLSLGINRLSIGIQSFNNQSLTALGRIHDGQQAIKAVETAHKVGFKNFNLDLMYGLPHQTAKTAREDIETAIALAPSTYLIINSPSNPIPFFISNHRHCQMTIPSSTGNSIVNNEWQKRATNNMKSRLMPKTNNNAAIILIIGSSVTI